MVLFMSGNLGKRELQSYIGDYFQVMGIKDYVFNSGKAKGVRAFDIKNGKCLEMTVLADKCMDIPYLSYKGVNIGFASKTGICAPEFYAEDKLKGFLKCFNAGFLTTCGLTYMGSACEDEGQELGLHGPIANVPAENVGADMRWQDDTAHMTVSGTMREACVFGEYLTLERKLSMNSAENKITLHDRIENRGQRVEPLMLLYHINFGYPMLNSCTKVYTNMDKITPRDETARKGIDTANDFSAPVVDYDEQVFLHTMSDSSCREASALVHNRELGLAVELRFDPTALPWLNHWKCPRAGDYALGLEPGTCNVSGRAKAKQDNILKYIRPGEILDFDIEVIILDEPAAIDEAISRLAQQH